MTTGTDVRISPQALIVNPDVVTIADHVAIDAFVVITTALRLGSYIHIGPHCSIIGGRHSTLVMEDFSGLAAGCRIICASDDFKGEGLINPTVPMKYRVVTYSTVTLRRFATLGTNCIALPGVTLGEGAVCAAGTLVTRDLDPWGIYAGSPARQVGERRRDKVLAYADEILRSQSGQQNTSERPR